MRQIAVTIQGRPPLLNAERSGHWRKHRETTKAIRLESALMLEGEAPMDQVKVDVWSFYKDRRLPDTAACVPALKAVIDGAVDAGLLKHDGPEIVRHVAFWAPRTQGDETVMVVTFEEIEGGDSPWQG